MKTFPQAPSRLLDGRAATVHAMFIAINRFKVARGSEADFEKVWTSRDSHLSDVPGFNVFHLLRGPENDESRAIFVAYDLAQQKRL